jgi:hypothetical protein
MFTTRFEQWEGNSHGPLCFNEMIPILWDSTVLFLITVHRI